MDFEFMKDMEKKFLVALELLEELVFPDDPCNYDHNNYCQSHGLHEFPCPHGRAKTLLKETEQWRKKHL